MSEQRRDEKYEERGSTKTDKEEEWCRGWEEWWEGWWSRPQSGYCLGRIVTWGTLAKGC